MRYLSLFDGIGAACVAWESLGWECVGVSEIEKFPIAVTSHHRPHVPHLGDVTKLTEEAIAALGRIDLIVGGFPCQDVSVAGKRAGLRSDDGTSTRSGLFFDAMRVVQFARERCGLRWLLIENVPGLFSNNSGRDFAAVVGAMVGAEFDVPRSGWRNAGFALGKDGLCEWCVLDAQFFNLAQRRERVFALADFGDWRSRGPLLLERAGLRGDLAPSRQTREGIAADVAHSLRGRSNASHREDSDTYVPATVGALTDGAHMGGGLTGRTPTPGESLPCVAMCLNAGAMGRQDAESETLIPTIGGGFDVAHSLRADGFDASEDGTGRGTPLVPVGITIHGTDKTARVASYTDVAGALRARPPGGQENSSTTAVLGFAQNQRDEVRTMDVAGALAKEAGMKQQTYIAFGAQNSARQGASASVTPTLDKSKVPGIGYDMRVRRLTPRECARLQGFPDDYLVIIFRGKPAADGNKYKALGNSMAVPCMRWIGERIAQVDALGTAKVTVGEPLETTA